MTFRPDINGLRAIAVLVVMLFHFGVPGFQGGFIGVDVFFTISGFFVAGFMMDCSGFCCDFTCWHLPGLGSCIDGSRGTLWAPSGVEASRCLFRRAKFWLVGKTKELVG